MDHGEQGHRPEHGVHVHVQRKGQGMVEERFSAGLGGLAGYLPGDPQIQAEVRKIADAGIRVFICKKCIEKLDVLKEVERWGTRFSTSGRSSAAY